jgi:hypothetical protein
MVPMFKCGFFDNTADDAEKLRVAMTTFMGDAATRRNKQNIS